MAKLPYMQFYPADYQADTRCLSLTSRGAWMDLICVLWRAEKRGRKTLPIEAWARELGTTSSEVSLIFTDLKHHKIANIDMDDTQAVTIVARRLLREEKRRAQDRRRQQEQRDKGGGDPMRWFAIRARILHLDKFLCGYCGKKARTVDHIIPRCDGGSDEDSNLIACCKGCNNIKNKKSLEECGFTIQYSSRHTTVTRAVTRAVTAPSQGDIIYQNQKSESEEEEELREEEEELREEKKEEKRASRVSVKRSTPPSDDEWLRSLERQEAYKNLPVRHELGKCQTWCDTNHKLFSRRRFVNWLNRIEQPMQATGPPVLAMVRPAPIPPFPGPEDPIGRSLWRKSYDNPASPVRVERR